jgi:hypothetical protein
VASDEEGRTSLVGRVLDHDHRLMPLRTELRTLLEQLDPRDDDREVPAIDEDIWQPDALEPGFFSFRCPTNRKGEVSSPELRDINVRHLGEVMGSVFMMLGGICEPSANRVPPRDDSPWMFRGEGGRSGNHDALRRRLARVGRRSAVPTGARRVWVTKERAWRRTMRRSGASG